MLSRFSVLALIAMAAMFAVAVPPAIASVAVIFISAQPISTVHLATDALRGAQPVVEHAPRR